MTNDAGALAGSTPASAPSANGARRGRPSTGARERILDAAIEVLKADGYAGLTIAKVAARAGESKPLIAYHYGSKQGLVQASGQAVAELVTAEALASIEGATTVEEVIRGAAEGVEGLLERDERLARLYFDLAAVSVVDPEIRATIAEVNDGWREVFVELFRKAADGPSPARARALALMVNAGIQGLALERIERGPTPELKRARDLFVESAVAAASSERR
jgi:TetR/AcrR family transcriptional regulator, transcriptional repressor of bet genes